MGKFTKADEGVEGEFVHGMGYVWVLLDELWRH